MIIGIIIGSLFGMVCSFIPNFNVGIILMIVSNVNPQQIPANELIGFIIGSFSICSIFQNLNKLPKNSSINALPHNSRNYQLSIIDNFPNYDTVSYRNSYGELSQCYHNYLTSELMGKVYGLILSIGIIICLGKKGIQLDNLGKSVCIVSIIGLFTILIMKTEGNKWKGIVGLVGSGLLGLCVVNIDMRRESVFILITCMFLPNSIRMIKGGGGNSELIIPEKEEDKRGTPIISGFFCGVISSIFWGIPINVACKGLEEDDDSNLLIAGRKGLANGIHSTLSLCLFLVLGSARGIIGHNLSKIHESLNGVEAIGILMINFVLYFIGLMWFEKIIKVYVRIYNNLPTKMISKIMVIICLVSIVVISKGWAVPILICVMMIDKLIKDGKAPSEIKMAALSIIPIINLV